MAKSLSTWVETISTQHEVDKDVCILVTGPEREGKSNFSFWLASKLDPSFHAGRMVFSAEQFMKQAKSMKPGQVLVLDEAIRGGFSRDAMTADNKELVKFLVVAGKLNIVMIILFPNIKFVDKYIKHHRAHWWALVEARGQVLIHKRRRSDYEGSKTSWPQYCRVTGVPKISGDQWDQYLANKDALVDDVGDSLEGVWTPPEEEVDKLVAKFRMILEDSGPSIE